MKKKIGAVALGCVLAWPLTGQAASQKASQNQNNQPAVVMGEVVVTATRQQEKVSTVPADVTVIDQQQIAASPARTVPDLLRTVAGVHVSDITGNGQDFTVDLRGFGETAGLNTLVLVDGRRINEPDLSGTDWTLIPLDRVQRIEIVRGGRGSVLYGDNAAGGVVNIITKDGGGPAKAGAEVAAGSYGTFTSRVSGSGSAGNLSYALSGGYMNTDGYRDNSGSEAKNAGLSLRYFLGDRAAFDLSSGYHKDDTDLPGALTQAQMATLPRTATVHPNDFSKTEDYYFKGGGELFFLTNSSLRMDLSYRQRDWLSYSSYVGGNFTGDTGTDTVAFTPHVVIREKVAGLPNKLILGFDHRESTEDIDNRSIYFGTPTHGVFELKKNDNGAYVHDEITPVHRLSLSAGYRHDRVKYSFQPSTPAEDVFSEDLYTTGLNYRYHGRSYLYTSYGKSFRYPVLDELFSFFTSTVEPGLQPQTTNDWEVGVRHYLTASFFINLNYFHLRTHHEIFFNPVAYANENLDGPTRRQGVELTVAKDFGWAQLSGSYTYTDAEILGGQFAGEDVPNVPEHQASVNALVPLPRGFSLALSGTYVGKRPFISDFANAFPEMDSYVVLNAKLKYHWRQLTAFLDVNNLLNEKYSEYGVIGYDSNGNEVRSYYPSPEANFLAGISLSF